MSDTDKIKQIIAAELHLELESTRILISNLSTKLKIVDGKVTSLEAELVKTKNDLILQENFNTIVAHDIRSTAISLNQLSTILAEEIA
jgi:hypothetical protein